MARTSPSPTLAEQVATHTAGELRGAAAMAIASGEAPSIVAGPADWDEEAGCWDRPNASDYAAAWAHVWRVIA